MNALWGTNLRHERSPLQTGLRPLAIEERPHPRVVSSDAGGLRSDFDGWKTHRQDDRVTDSFPGVDNLGAENHVIAFRPECNLLLSAVDMERHL